MNGYQVLAEDHWKGFMGKLGKVWPNANSKLEFKFEVESFDSQVTFLDGKRQNLTAGLQSWNYYEIENDELPEKRRMEKRIRFGLSAYQYFFELLHRLRNAPIISWAGQEEFNDQLYDVLFITWEKPEPHKEHDQYKLLINQTTGLLDYAVYSLRENYLKMPGGQAFYGSIKLDDYRKVDGILIPYRQTVFLNAPKEKMEKHVHQLIVKDFKFDNFDMALLKPFGDIRKTGDSKAKG